jgi:hypothetical protein
LTRPIRPIDSLTCPTARSAACRFQDDAVTDGAKLHAARQTVGQIPAVEPDSGSGFVTVAPRVETTGLAALALLILVLGLPACSKSPPERGLAERVQADYSPNGRLTRLTYDRDGDGKIDTWGYMDGTRVLRVEIDEDGDGRPDRWEFHRAAREPGGRSATDTTAGVDKTLERIERASRRDGRVDRREYFVDGALARVEADGDGDGQLDKWETYEDGTLTTMSLDTQHRGRPDRRLIYAADGSFIRVEADLTGSGTFTPVTP